MSVSWVATEHRVESALGGMAPSDPAADQLPEIVDELPFDGQHAVEGPQIQVLPPVEGEARYPAGFSSHFRRAGGSPVPPLEREVVMELISRMMDGSISYDPENRLEPVTSGPGARQEDKIERLKEVPMFEGCSQRQLQSVARIARIFDVAANTVLARAGEPGDEFFLIMDGSARVEVSACKLALLRPGEFFGEMSILDGSARSATVSAETAVRLLVISRQHFSALLADVPDLTQALLVTLSRRVRQAEDRMEQLGAASTGL